MALPAAWCSLLQATPSGSKVSECGKAAAGCLNRWAALSAARDKTHTRRWLSTRTHADLDSLSLLPGCRASAARPRASVSVRVLVMMTSMSIMMKERR